MILSINNKDQYDVQQLLLNNMNTGSKLSNGLLNVFVREVKLRLLNIIHEKQLNDFIDTKQYLTSCDQIISVELNAIFEKIFIVEKKIFLTENNKNFNDALKTTNYQEELLRAYPGAYKAALSLINQFVNTQSLFLDRFKKDYTEIKAIFPANKVLRLETIQECGGDLHCGGEQALKLTLNEKWKLYYKPHCDGSNYTVLKEIIKWIAVNSSQEEDAIQLPDFIFENQYIWQQCIEFNSITLEKNIKSFYRKQGVLLSIFYMLGSVDMHCENIISSNGSPIPIDLETLFSNVAIQTQTESMPFTGSVLQTSMLPYYFSKSNFNYDISGILGISVSDDEIDSNLPDRNYLERNSKKIEKEVINGFYEGYQTVLSNKQAFKKIIMQLPNTTCRFIYRPTATYQKLLSALHHPSYQLNESNTNDLIDNALRSSEKFFLNHEIEKSEKKDILMHNYPIFFFRVDSKSLIDSMGNEIPNFFAHSALDRTIDKVNRMSTEDLKRQANLIHLAFETRFDTSRDNEVLYKNSIKNLMHSIDSTLIIDSNGCAESYKLSEPVRLVDNVERKTILPLGNGLYDGYAGIAITFALLHKEYPNNQLIKKILDGTMQSISKGPIGISNSAFFGECSVLYAELYIGLMQDNALVIQATIKKIRNKILQVSEKEIDSFDYLTGISSFSLFISNVFKLKLLSTQDIELIAAITLIKRKYLKFSIDVLENKRNYLTGFAHGFSGLAVGLAALYKITLDEKVLPIICRLVSKEDAFLSKKEGKWVDLRVTEKKTFCNDFFCYGLPGISLARQLIFEQTKMDIGLTDCKRMLEEHKKRTIEVEPDCLCHGKFGNAFILNCLNIHIENLAFPNVKLDSNSVDLMNGLSGVLLYDLQLQGVKISNPMTFELPMNRGVR